MTPEFQQIEEEIEEYGVRLTIVDLAGAERNKRTKNDFKRLKESNSVNLSLSVLRKCFDALKQGKRVPFRDNKLSHYLKKYFNENKCIIMIVNINPSQKDFEETLQVLEYGTIAKKIDKVKSRINNRINPEYLVKKKKVRRLIKGPEFNHEKEIKKEMKKEVRKDENKPLKGLTRP